MFWRLKVLVFYTIISLFIISFFLVLFIPMKNLRLNDTFRYKVAEIFSRIFINLVWVILDIKYKIIGLEKLPIDKKPYLVLANHQSFWENFFMQLIIPTHSWVIKKELYDIPVFGWSLKTLYPIAVDRSNNRSITQILTEGIKKFESGQSLILFPEATRVKIDKNVRFKPSAAKLAINAKVPIVMIVHNAGVFWPKGFWFTKSGTITVKITEVMYQNDIFKYDVRSLTDYIQERINTEKQKLVEDVLIK